MPEAIPSIHVGQVWRTRGGDEVRVEEYTPDRPYPWRLKADDGVRHVTETGNHAPTGEHSFDLVELLNRRDTDVKFADALQASLRDSNDLAAETLLALGWHFDGQAWVQENAVVRDSAVLSHPLYPVYVEAIEQAMYGKGQRHGGAVTPFLDQPWVHYVKMHGRGFATGQSAKKLEEAASTRDGAPYDAEVLGAIVYAGMSILKNRGQV